MATFGVAASVALLKPVIAKLSSEAWKNMSMFWHLDKKCEKLKNMLATISTVLTDAEKKSITDELIHDWLSQLQDVAYDIDDLLDDFQIEIERRSKSKSTVRAVHDFFSADNPVKFRANMVKKLKKITKRLSKIMVEKKKYELVEGNVMMEQDNTDRETFSVVNEHEVYGREEDKEILVDILIHSQNDLILSILPLVGMGGVGKTTLAQIVCKDPEIKRQFEPIAWVHVPMNFQLSTILCKLIECISGKGCEVSNIETMQQNLRSMISGTKFLLVLDDVWNEDPTKWEKLETILGCGMAGSKILVTTRSERVAEIMGTFDYFRVNTLEFQYCWELFKQRAFQHIDEEENADLVDIGEHIVRKCQGLPLAAKHLGNLAGSREVDWYAIRDNEIWQINECGSGIVPSLLLSYYYLPPHLKRCFAYCSIFPKGFLFEEEYIIQLWICEGFIPELKWPAANLCFDYLLSRSFFEECERSTWDSCMYRMHDLIHDLACYVAGEKFFLRSESQKIQSKVTWRYAVSLNNDIEIKKLRTLLIPNYTILGRKLDLIMQLQYLRVLNLSYCWIEELPFQIGNLRHLKYLDLCGNRFIRKLPDSITTLLCLEVLDLSWCEDLNMLPNCLGAIEKLEVLDLHHCHSLNKLPTSLGSLTNLRILNLMFCTSLVSVPNGIGKLTKLERLPFLIIGGEEGCSIGELGQLNLLQNDMEIVVEENWGQQDIYNTHLEAKINLKSLQLRLRSTSKGESRIPIGILQLPQKLENLCIKWDLLRPSYQFDLPSSLRTINFPFIYTKLVNVELHGIIECECFPQFGLLPALKFLHLSLEFSITKIKEQFSGNCGMYPALEDLELSQCCYTVVSEERIVETGTMRWMFPRLKKAYFSCPFMTVFPFLPRSIENLIVSDDCGERMLSGYSLQGLYQLRKLILTCLPIYFNAFEGITYLTSLEELEISYGDWFYLPPSLLHHELPLLSTLKIKQMNDLRLIEKERLEIEGDEISSILPPLFYYLENLIIEHCDSLRELPDWLGYLPLLQSLRVENCPNLIEFPESISVRSTLQTLHLSKLPNIRRLTDSFEYLTELQSLVLSGLYNLQRLPRGTEQLPSLQKLTIVDCFKLLRQYRMRQCKDVEVYYKKEEGGDWYEISHIPYMNIYPVKELPKDGEEIESDNE